MKRFLPKWLVAGGLALAVLVPAAASAAPVRSYRFDHYYGTHWRPVYRGDWYGYGRRDYDDWNGRSRWFRARRGFYGARSRAFSFSFGR